MPEDFNDWVTPCNDSKDCKGNLSYTAIRLLLILCVNLSYPQIRCMPDGKYFTEFFSVLLATFLSCPVVNGGVWRVKDLSLNFETVSHAFIFTFVQGQPEIKKWSFYAFTTYILYHIPSA